MLHKPYKRRRFLQTAGLASAGLATSFATSLVRSHQSSASTNFSQDVQALVIGSGYGGAVAALRLGQAGIRTLVLERGRRWQITPEQNTFATLDKPDRRSAWLSPRTVFNQPVPVYTGIFEENRENGITVWAGAGVGGSSLVNNAITYQPRRDIFYKVFSSSLVNYDELDRIYYPRVRSMLQASPIPADILATDYYEKVRLLMQHATNAGFPNRLLDLAVDWDIVREEINGTKVPSTIIGNIWWGINSGAKNSLDHNYLPQAEETGYVDILPLHVALEISELSNGKGYQVSCNEINELGEVVGQKSITCRYLFLAAGSLGTSKLLVKSKAKGKLPRLNNNVGKYWGNNADIIVMRSGLPPVSNNGGTSGAVIENLDDKYPHVIMNLDNSLESVGEQVLLDMAIPDSNGFFKYDGFTDSVKLNFSRDSPGNQAVLKAIEKTHKILDKKNPTFGSKEPSTHMRIPKPNDRLSNQPQSMASDSITAHPLGGCVMGKACDPYGRVYGYQGLYVVDGAFIAGSTAVTNPLLTIAALAERSMERILVEDMKLSIR
ncbi:GMC family oxidoreductase N-terminal domain-containing protein [Nostoc sp. CHAB 5824]|nr:GMC family oxidoreductase N-terminal domain-containing protein [Nostoc sp. CHAB 5824]